MQVKTSFKDKLVSALGAFGTVLWYLIALAIASLPFAILKLPFWGILVFMLLISIPFVNIIAGAGLYIWAFIEALGQKQDAVVIAFYVVFAILALYVVIAVLPVVFTSRRQR